MVKNFTLMMTIQSFCSCFVRYHLSAKITYQRTTWLMTKWQKIYFCLAVV